MSEKKPPCCGTCKFGKFALQKNGRINRHWAGECLFVPVLPPLPLSITKAHGFREFYKSCVTYDMTGCPTYEARKESP